MSILYDFEMNLDFDDSEISPSGTFLNILFALHNIAKCFLSKS